MKVLGRDKVLAFQVKHPTSRAALNRLVKLFENVQCSSPMDFKKIFGVNVDFVGKQIVFDAGGNKVRVITKVEYGLTILLITHVLTHAEYDRNKWKE